MSTAVGELRVDLTGDWADFRTNLQRAGDSLGQFGQKFAGVAGTVAKAGLRIAGAAVAAGAAFALMSTRAAEEAASARDAFDDAFGDMSARANEWATTTAGAFDLSQRAIREQATAFQTLFAEIAPTNEAAATLSERFTELANDFAALHNIAPEKAVERFQQALSGSGRAMRQYGIDLSETVVRAEALRRGIITQDQVLSNEQATLVRASLLMRELGDATGAYEEDADSAEAATRRMRQASDDASESLGNSLLPAMTALKEAAAGALNAFTNFFNGIGERIAASDTWVIRLYQVREALHGNFVAYENVAAALGRVRAAQAAGSTATQNTAGAIRGLTNDTQTYADSIIGLARQVQGGGMREGVRSWAEQHAADIERLREQLNPTAGALAEYTEQMEIARRAGIDFSEAQRAHFVRGLIEAGGGVEVFKGRLEELPEVFQRVANEMIDADLTAGVQQYRDALKDFAQELEDEFSGESALEQRLTRIDEAFANGLVSMKVWQEARTAAMEEQNGAVNDLDEVNQRIRASGEARDQQWKNLATTLGNVADRTQTLEDAWKSLILQFARAQLIQPFLDRLFQGGKSGGGIIGSGLSGLFGSAASSLFGGGKALGGSVAPGMAYEVGERGRELFVPDTPGQIVPTGQYGGTTINVYTPDANSFRASRRQISREERRKMDEAK